MKDHAAAATEPRLAEPVRRFGVRAKTRLRIASVLLRHALVAIDADNDEAYVALLCQIDALDPRQRARLRAHVDWVEAYESEESHAHSCRAQHVRRHLPP
jgi:hypothetical protein